MPRKKTQLPVPSTGTELMAFVEAMNNLPKVELGRGRLIFAMDATASRERTWEMAKLLQKQMFEEVRDTNLQCQLVSFGGDDFAGWRGAHVDKTEWTRNADRLKKLMDYVLCDAGNTQIREVFHHVGAQQLQDPVAAVIYVGDEQEQWFDDVLAAAKAMNVKAFMFHERGPYAVRNDVVERQYRAIAEATGGLYAVFNPDAPGVVATMLRSVAAHVLGREAQMPILLPPPAKAIR